jgi:hypothetical protein
MGTTGNRQCARKTSTLMHRMRSQLTQTRSFFFATSEDEAWKRNGKRTLEDVRMKSHTEGGGTYCSDGGCVGSGTLHRPTAYPIEKAARVFAKSVLVGRKY